MAPQEHTTAVFVLTSLPLVGEGLAHVLKDAPDLKFAGFSADPLTVVSELDRSRPDILLVDQAFGLRTAFELITSLRRTVPELRIILWTKDLSSADRRQALEAGVAGLVDRTRSADAHLECIRLVAAGQVPAETGTSLSPRPDDRVASRLTARERQILALVQVGMKNREIAERLSITAGTVKVHLMHIFEKTGLRDRFELSFHAGRLLSVTKPGVTKPGVAHREANA